MLPSIAGALITFEQENGLGAVPPAIQSLRDLPVHLQDDLFEICKCFTDNATFPNVSPSRAAYKVWRAIVEEVYPRRSWSVSPEKAVATALHALNHAGLLTRENFDIMRADSDLCTNTGASKALHELDLAILLTQESFNAITTRSGKHIASILKVLNKARLLTQENFDLVIMLTDLNLNERSILLIIDEAHLLNQSNLDVIKILANTNPQRLEDITTALQNMVGARLVTQENFDALITVPIRISHIIERLKKRHLFTQEIFNQLILFAHQPNPEEYIYTLLEQPASLTFEDIITHEAVSPLIDDGILTVEDLRGFARRIRRSGGRDYSSLDSVQEIIIGFANLINREDMRTLIYHHRVPIDQLMACYLLRGPEDAIEFVQSMAHNMPRFEEIINHTLVRPLLDNETVTLDILREVYNAAPNEDEAADFVIGFVNLINHEVIRPLVFEHRMPISMLKDHYLREGPERTIQFAQFAVDIIHIPPGGSLQAGNLEGALDASFNYPQPQGFQPPAVKPSKGDYERKIYPSLAQELTGQLGSFGEALSPLPMQRKLSIINYLIGKTVGKLTDNDDLDAFVSEHDVHHIFGSLPDFNILIGRFIGKNLQLDEGEVNTIRKKSLVQAYRSIISETYLFRFINKLEEQLAILSNHQGINSTHFSSSHPALPAINAVILLLGSQAFLTEGLVLTDEMVDILSRTPFSAMIHNALDGSEFETGSTRDFLKLLQKEETREDVILSLASYGDKQESRAEL